MADRIPPALAEALGRALENDRVDLHTCAPGRVRSFSLDEETAEIELLLRRVIPAADDTEEDTVEDYPILPSVPVCYPGGGGMRMSWPLQAGDLVLVIFAESDLNQYRATGTLADPGVSTRHGLSGALCLPVRPHPRGQANGEATTSQWIVSMGGVSIQVGDGEVRCGGDRTLSKSTEVQAQLDALAADIVAVNGAIPSMTSAPALTFNAVKTANPIATTVTKGL